MTDDPTLFPVFPVFPAADLAAVTGWDGRDDEGGEGTIDDEVSPFPVKPPSLIDSLTDALLLLLMDCPLTPFNTAPPPHSLPPLPSPLHLLPLLRHATERQWRNEHSQIRTDILETDDGLGRVVHWTHPLR